jgi:6-phosphofructokinase 1
MDGDLSSFISLGWHTAVTVGSQQTRWHHHCAVTNRRIFFVGLFGRNTDWTLCGVTAYGGGDLGIPCELEYEFEFVLHRIEEAVKRNRERYGIEFAVVPYSEGTRIRGLKPPPDEHCSYDEHDLPKLQPEWIGMELARNVQGRGLKAAFQAHTYDLRDTPPTAIDKRLSGMAGAECIHMILEGDFGKAVTFEPDGRGFFQVARAPLQQVARQRKLEPTGLFDYDLLCPTQKFVDTYGDLFKEPLGRPPAKDELVYRNLLRR